MLFYQRISLRKASYMTYRRKTLQELTIKDNFMFAAVMLDPELCKGLLERALSRPIDKVTVITEKSLVYHPEYKGVRLDVYAKDENSTHFNVEMQVANSEIFKRSRYYHIQIASELLQRGTDYELLPDSYVIFICDFDPFGYKKYRYTIKQSVAEIGDSLYDDGCHTVFLSTKGTNRDEVPPELANFLDFVRSCDTCANDGYPSPDEFVQRCTNSVRQIKSSLEMGGRYMLFEDILKDEFKAGKAEGLTEGKSAMLEKLLSSKGVSAESISAILSSVSDATSLDKLFELALSADTSAKLEQLIDQFK